MILNLDSEKLKKYIFKSIYCDDINHREIYDKKITFYVKKMTGGADNLEIPNVEKQIKNLEDNYKETFERFKKKLENIKTMSGTDMKNDKDLEEIIKNLDANKILEKYMDGFTNSYDNFLKIKNIVNESIVNLKELETVIDKIDNNNITNIIDLLKKNIGNIFVDVTDSLIIAMTKLIIKTSNYLKNKTKITNTFKVDDKDDNTIEFENFKEILNSFLNDTKLSSKDKTKMLEISKEILDKLTWGNIDDLDDIDKNVKDPFEKIKKFLSKKIVT